MEKFLKEQYAFTSYQIAQLKYVGKTIASEMSKLLIIGLLFHRQLPVYTAAVFLMLLLRTTTGGLHCKKYFSCFLMSFSFLFLSIRVLPLLKVPEPLPLLLLFACIPICYYTGPVTSAVHRPLSPEQIEKSRKRIVCILFFYLLLMCFTPENPYCTTGFWVVILHTLQLITAKIRKKGEKT